MALGVPDPKPIVTVLWDHPVPFGPTSTQVIQRDSGASLSARALTLVLKLASND